MSDPIMALEELENIVKSKEAPFQIFAKMLDGKTITINDVTSKSSILSIMKAIEAKEGLPANSQRLLFAGKQLEQDKTAGDYNLQKEITLHVVLRLNGGKGEFDAMNYLRAKNINRGNVYDDIVETKAESYILKNWGRSLTSYPNVNDPDNPTPHEQMLIDRHIDFMRQIFSVVLPTLENSITPKPKDDTDEIGKKKFKRWKREQWSRWYKKNYVHLKALIQETTHSGNCGDFAQIVQSRLLQSTSNQYVSILTMCGPLPDEEQNEVWNSATKKEKRAWLTHDKAAQKAINEVREKAKKPLIVVHNYDHQLCLTYHTPETNLANIDPDRAMVADGWGGNQVAPLSKFLAGYNAYNDPMPAKRLGISYPNLKLSGCKKAEGKEAIDPTLKNLIQQKIDTALQNYIEGDFTKDQQDFIGYITKEGANTSWIFDLGPRDDIDYDMDVESIVLKLNKIPLPQETQIFREECLDLDSFELVDYFFAPKAKKDHKKFILEEEELKAHLFQFLLEKATVLNLGETRAAGLAKHLPVKIDEDTLITQELLDQLRVK